MKPYSNIILVYFTDRRLFSVFIVSIGLLASFTHRAQAKEIIQSLGPLQISEERPLSRQFYIRTLQFRRPGLIRKLSGRLLDDHRRPVLGSNIFWFAGLRKPGEDNRIL